jgi:NTE family protein
VATAFVLSGGGSLGAVQVGMLQALTDRGIEPDMIVGTSVGALNGAYVAAHGTSPDSLERLQRIWGGLRRGDVFPLQAARLAAAAIGRAPSLCANDALRRLIADHVALDRLEDAAIRLLIVATDVRTGEEIGLSAGDTADAVLASAAIPSIFPSVRIGDRDLIDGGIADNAAVTQAVALGADIVYVLPTGYACALASGLVGACSSAQA